MNGLILYTTEDGRSQIKLRAKDQTVWLSQREMAQLFDVSTDNVGLHLKNIFEDRELEANSVTEESSVTAADGKNYLTKLYNLDAILAVGYRVRSPRGVQFRRWASTLLKEYLTKGFVMDDDRLKNPDGRPDYFDEMLERIRNIRASEKRFYQKVRDLFSLSSDYDKTDTATQAFFATVQNLLIFAVTRKTAAELITTRANPADPRSPATDDSITIDPPSPDFRISGIVCFTVRNTPSTLIAICRRQSASDISIAGPMIPIPALATTISSRPKRFSVAAATSIQPASSVTSGWM